MLRNLHVKLTQCLLLIARKLADRDSFGFPLVVHENNMQWADLEWDLSQNLLPMLQMNKEVI